MSSSMVPAKTTTDLLAEREALYRAVSDAAGELSPDVENKLLENANAIALKADSIQYVIARLEADEEFLKAEAKKYGAAAKIQANAAKRIKDRIKFLMRENNLKTLSGNTIEFSLGTSAPALVGDGIPEGFGLIVTETVPDKERIKAALVAGEKIDGYELVSSGTLRTKINVK